MKRISLFLFLFATFALSVRCVTAQEWKVAWESKAVALEKAAHEWESTANTYNAEGVERELTAQAKALAEHARALAAAGRRTTRRPQGRLLAERARERAAEALEVAVLIRETADLARQLGGNVGAKIIQDDHDLEAWINGAQAFETAAQMLEGP